MQKAEIKSMTMRGVGIVPVTVGVSIQPGLPSLDIKGGSEEELAGIRSKVRCALREQALEVPHGKISVDIDADGASLRGADGLALPVLCGVLAASGQVDARAFDGFVVVGDLTLEGVVNAPERGCVQAAVLAEATGRRLLSGPVTLPYFSGNGHRCVEYACELAADGEIGREAFALPEPDLRREMDPDEVLKTAERLYDIDPWLALNAANLGSARAAYVTLDEGATIEDASSFLASALGKMDRGEFRQHALASSACPGRNRFGRSAAPALTLGKDDSMATLLGGGRPVQPGLLTRAGCGAVLIEDAEHRDDRLISSLIGPVQDREVRLVRADGTYPMPADCTVLFQVGRNSEGIIETTDTTGLMAACGAHDIVNIKSEHTVHAAEVGKVAGYVRGTMRRHEREIDGLVERAIREIGPAKPGEHWQSQELRSKQIEADVRGQVGVLLAGGADPASLGEWEQLAPETIASDLGISVREEGVADLEDGARGASEALEGPGGGEHGRDEQEH